MFQMVLKSSIIDDEFSFNVSESSFFDGDLTFLDEK